MNANVVAEHPVVVVAKAEDTDSDIQTLSTGIRCQIMPVSAALIQEVTSRIKDPQVPLWHNKEKGRDEPNPNDPGYVAELGEANSERGKAAMDALIMFGIDLIDSLPEDNRWLKKLQYMGIQVDETDSFEVEFAYKKYVAVGNQDLILISQKAGISQEAIEDAAKSFRG